MQICRASACLISPGSSIVAGVQDSASRANGKPAGRSWESEAFYRLIEEQRGPIHPGVGGSCNCTSPVKHAS
jgi:hypothetical protein